MMRSPPSLTRLILTPLLFICLISRDAAQAQINTIPNRPNILVPRTSSQLGEHADSSEKLLEQGKQQLENEQNEAALQSFQQALTIARHVNDPLLEGKALRGTGDAYLRLYDVAKATAPLEQALILARKLKNRELEAAVLNSLGWRSQALKDDFKALEYQQQAIALARAAQTPDLETEILRDLGDTYDALEDYPAAIEAYQQRLTLARAIKNRRTEGKALHQLAFVYDELADYPKALNYAQNALVLAKAVGDRNLEANLLVTLGNVYYAFKQPQKATAFYQQSLIIANQANYAHGQFAATANLGVVNHLLLKDNAKALAFYQQALAIAQSRNDQGNVSTLLVKLSELYKLLNDQPKVVAAYQQAVKAELADTHLQCASQEVYAIGRTYADLNQFPKALSYYQQALTTEQQADQPKCQLKILLSMGDSHNDLKDHANVLTTFQQALLLARHLNDQRREFKILAYGFGRTFYNQNDYSTAIAYYQQALDVARRMKNRRQQSIMLSQIGSIYFENLKDYPKAIELYQQAVAIDRELMHRGFEISDLTDLGSIYNLQKNAPKAIEFYQQALAIARGTQNRVEAMKTLNRMGNAYRDARDYPKAIASYQQALAIARDTNNLYDQANFLKNMGDIYSLARDEANASTAYEQVLRIAKATNDGDFRLRKLLAVGYSYGLNLGTWPKSIALSQQALVLARERKDRQQEGSALGLLGMAYNIMGNLPKAIEFLQQGVAIAQETQDLQQEGIYLANLSANYIMQGDAEKALTTGQQALAIARGEVSRDGIAIRDRNTEALALIGVGAASMVGKQDYQTARTLLQQGLTIAQETKDRLLESFALSYLSLTDVSLSNYPKALQSGNQALTIAQDIKSSGAELIALSALASSYKGLGDYPRAITTNQQSLALARQSYNQPMEGITLLELGEIASNQGNARQAMDFAQQAVVAFEVSKSPLLKTIALLALASGYGDLKEYANAIANAQEALQLARRLKNRDAEYTALKTLGYFYRKLGQDEQAIAYYQSALAVNATPELPGSDSGVHIGLARVYQRKKMPVVAIAYYKKAVSGIEAVRHKIRGLPPQLQLSFIQRGQKGETAVDIYRELADLLLEQGRVLEAQQVMDLLKVQEIKAFRRERGTDKTPELAFSRTEETILKQQGTLIAFGRKVLACEQTQCLQLNQLYDQRKALTHDYNQTMTRLEQTLGDRRQYDPNFFDPQKLGKINAIVNAQPNTVMISPLVLDDRLWLLWASSGGVFKSVEVPVKLKDLAVAVRQLREAMRPDASIQAVQTASKRLYDWLIKPLAGELKANKIENLVFALDRVTRYIPMGVLFDGKQYLIETYTLSTVLSADTDTHDRLPTDIQRSSVLALGASTFVGFDALPNVPSELNAIVRSQPSDTSGIYPGQKYLNDTFDEYALQRLSGHNILHIASHAEFVSGRPEDSYLVLGNSKKLSIPALKDLLSDLTNIHLVVLSACETALGGENLDGVEISGISSYFLTAGAKTVLASLWSVNDSSTSLLMQRFYTNLAQATSAKPITKAQALRQAQLVMLRETSQATQQTRGDSFKLPAVAGSSPSIARDLSHPYYWAPFILIGNGL